MNKKTLKQYKEEQMLDKLFAKEYEAIQSELDAIRSSVEASDSYNVPQKGLEEQDRNLK